MGKLKLFSNFSNLKTWDDASRFVSAFADDLVKQINGNLAFGDNIKAAGPYTQSFTANTVTEIAHSLGIVPQGWVLINTDTSGLTLYRAPLTSVWTTAKVYLEANITGSATFYLI